MLLYYVTCIRNIVYVYSYTMFLPNGKKTRGNFYGKIFPKWRSLLVHDIYEKYIPMTKYFPGKWCFLSLAISVTKHILWYFYLTSLALKIGFETNENVRKSATLKHQKLQIKNGKLCIVTLIPKGRKQAIFR